MQNYVYLQGVPFFSIDKKLWNFYATPSTFWHFWIIRKRRTPFISKCKIIYTGCPIISVWQKFLFFLCNTLYNVAFLYSASKMNAIYFKIQNYVYRVSHYFCSTRNFPFFMKHPVYFVIFRFCIKNERYLFKNAKLSIQGVPVFSFDTKFLCNTLYILAFLDSAKKWTLLILKCRNMYTGCPIFPIDTKCWNFNAAPCIFWHF